MSKWSDVLRMAMAVFAISQPPLMPGHLYQMAWPAEPKPRQKSGKDRTKIKAARAQNRRRKK